MHIRIFITILVITSSIISKTIYVDNKMTSSGDGSLTSPLTSLKSALLEASENDSIILREGTYEEGSYEIRINNLTITSYPDEWAILQVPTDNSDIQYVIRYAISITGGKLNRLELIGGYYYCLKFESNWNWDNSVPFSERKGASNVTIQNCKIHGSGRDCIKITPASNDLSFINCEIYNSGIRDDSNAEGIDNVNGSNMLVENCFIHDIATNGVYAKGGAKYATVKNCVIMNCGVGGIVGGFYTDAEWFDTDDNPNYHEAISPSFYNNYVINTSAGGVGLFGTLYAHVYNNTIINTGHTYQASLDIVAGDIWLSSSNSAKPKNVSAWIVNNLIYNNIETGAIFQIRENAIDSNSIIDYNLFYSTHTAEFEMEDYQSWPNYTFEEYQANTPYGTNSISSDPLLDDNYHLTANSPAIDKGYTDSVMFIDYDGQWRNSWDIGADEYSLESGKKVPPIWSDIVNNKISNFTKSTKRVFPQLNNIKQITNFLRNNKRASFALYNVLGQKYSEFNYTNIKNFKNYAKGIHLGIVKFEGSFKVVKILQSE